MLEQMKYTDGNIKLIYEKTKGQAENELWHHMRRGLITASNFHRVSTRTDTLIADPTADPSKLLDTLFKEGSPSPYGPDSLVYGRNSEPVAKNCYQKVMSKVCPTLKVQETGLLLSEHFPFIGCSADGIVSCKCHSKKLIEIKCPFALKHLSPREAALQRGCYSEGDTLKLKMNTDYFYQIQGQMGLHKIHKCDLVIFTSQGIQIVEVDFNVEFYKLMIAKLVFFYRAYAAVHLLKMAAGMHGMSLSQPK